ncbi:hypothetical protein HMPREF1092_00569 [Clostridium thermobutyricum]|uniref:Uncharacterized protein n=1 Tax=Clostridium thermobutyricum TaxID=29372 RepID=N9XUJ4_9CLOT|nr:hypothetical protein [Clostridium thermobutyricum]ENZ03383.1 hypothetical protein HMPREF1092_00569 [Clostridium thermobutyricum]
MNIKEQVKLMRNIIENEYRHIQNREREALNLESDDYRISQNNQDELINKLQSLLDKEGINYLDDLIMVDSDIMGILSEYYFKEGVKAGLTNLSFLNEYETKLLL